MELSDAEYKIFMFHMLKKLKHRTKNNEETRAVMSENKLKETCLIC